MGFKGSAVTSPHDEKIFYLMVEESLEPIEVNGVTIPTRRSMVFGPYNYLEVRSSQNIRRAILKYLREEERADMNNVTISTKVAASGAAMAKVQLMADDMKPSPPKDWTDE